MNIFNGSSQIGGSNASNLFRSFPRPHSSPKMKLRSRRKSAISTRLYSAVYIPLLASHPKLTSCLHVSCVSSLLVRSLMFVLCVTFIFYKMQQICYLISIYFVFIFCFPLHVLVVIDSDSRSTSMETPLGNLTPVDLGRTTILCTLIKTKHTLHCR